MSAPAPTAPITYQVPDSAITVTLTTTDTDLPRVETRASGFICDDWTRTFATEAEARTAARHAAEAFQGYTSTAELDRDAETLRQQVAALIRIRRPLTTTERRALAAAEARLERIADLNELATLTNLTASLAA